MYLHSFLPVGNQLSTLDLSEIYVYDIFENNCMYFILFGSMLLAFYMHATYIYANSKVKSMLYILVVNSEGMSSTFL